MPDKSVRSLRPVNFNRIQHKPGFRHLNHRFSPAAAAPEQRREGQMPTFLIFICIDRAAGNNHKAASW
ncbi:Hypothetical predicted protein [Cloeon dipterum]|uniref:Uncharacterized protein n=1 Tax=Cloeon dipterum TaxID=197152 RepID=A0A8S1D7C6_9INSE|nr:Hypothetical predicted protein [Cloeon dipterum]